MEGEESSRGTGLEAEEVEFRCIFAFTQSCFCLCLDVIKEWLLSSVSQSKVAVSGDDVLRDC